MHGSVLQVRAALLQHRLLALHSLPHQPLAPQPRQLQDLHVGAPAAPLLRRTPPCVRRLPPTHAGRPLPAARPPPHAHPLPCFQRSQV